LPIFKEAMLSIEIGVQWHYMSKVTNLAVIKVMFMTLGHVDILGLHQDNGKIEK